MRKPEVAALIIVVWVIFLCVAGGVIYVNIAHACANCPTPQDTEPPPVKTTQPPVKTTEPPVVTTEPPPVKTTESPVVTTEPPATTEPPVVMTEPPDETQPPKKDREPKKTPTLPVTGNEAAAELITLLWIAPVFAVGFLIGRWLRLRNRR